MKQNRKKLKRAEEGPAYFRLLYKDKVEIYQKKNRQRSNFYFKIK